MLRLWEFKMRVEDYGYTMDCYSSFENKYVVNFYEHRKFTHSITISHEDVEHLPKAFPKYKMVDKQSAGLIDASNSRIGMGTTAPSHRLNISVQITPPFPLIHI